MVENSAEKQINKPFTQEELKAALGKIRVRKDQLAFWYTEFRDEDDSGESREKLIAEGKVLDIAANVFEIILGEKKDTTLKLSEKSNINLK